MFVCVVLCVYFTYFEVLFVKKVGTLGYKRLGYNAVPLGREGFLDEVAFELADLPKVNFKVRVGGGLILGRETHALDVVHLKQKTLLPLAWMSFSCSFILSQFLFLIMIVLFLSHSLCCLYF